MNQRTGDKVLLASLLAGLLGAGLALLFAPSSGKETREKIRAKAGDMKHQAEDSLVNVRKSLDHNIREAQDLKDRITEAIANKNRKFDEDKETYSKNVRDQDTSVESPVLSTWEEEG